jgi:2-succinyl-5-enolpyruvyl-6-hydroxy-3-cyclohexene-1-carboxylate synthase
MLYDLQTEWATLVLSAFRSAGVTEVMVSPGSRSTPFVLAALRVPDLQLIDIVDERVAAFFAVGRARVTGRPSLCLCTSGTAGAHYLPAVIEAHLTATPLLLMTADRPLELQACGAPQTIDQVKLFGDHVRSFVELGMADAAPSALRATRRAVAAAVAAAKGGPVHLNVRARKPLEPRAAETDGERALALRVRTESAKPLVQPFASESLISEEALDTIADACRRSARGLIVCGPAGLWQAPRPDDVLSLSRLTGFPVLAEAASQLRFAGLGDELIDGFDGLLQVDRFARTHAADMILQLGAPPISSAWERFLAQHTHARLHVISTQAWADPSGRAVAVAQGNVELAVRALTERLTADEVHRSRDRDDWGTHWLRANSAAWEAISSLLEQPGPFSEAQAVRTTISHLRPDCLLMLGNSLAIRNTDALCPSKYARCEVLSQRGASGIDGLVSGAAGAASTGRPLLLLVGDVSLLHDLGGLHAAAKMKTTLIIVVLNNRGGRIFEQLPIGNGENGGIGKNGTTPPQALDHFTTPHQLDFSHAAAFFEIPYRCATTISDLSQALAFANERQGATLVEVQIPPRSAADTADVLRSRIAQALDHAGFTGEPA